MLNGEETVQELLHQAAYSGSSMGYPMFADEHSVHHVSSDSVDAFYKTYFQPSRLTVAATGMSHAELEEIAITKFGDLVEGDSVTSQAAAYSGGELRMKQHLEDPDLHYALAFESESWASADLEAMCVLSMMMGGGGSFSAGGPGKGMYTRLYQDVLMKQHYVSHVSCSHSIFEDTGLFYLYGMAAPADGNKLARELATQAKQMASRKADETELARAKNALASNIAFECENRQIQFEDLAKQVAIFGKHRSIEEWSERISKVSAEQVQKVAQKMIKTKPTVVVYGSDFGTTPSYDEVCKILSA